MKEDTNNEDDMKILMENLTNFVYPRFKELEDMLTGDKKPGMLKLMKIAKEFSDKLKIDYKEKFENDLDDDLKKVTKIIGSDLKGMNKLDLLKIFKNNTI